MYFKTSHANAQWKVPHAYNLTNLTLEFIHTKVDRHFITSIYDYFLGKQLFICWKNKSDGFE